MSSILDRFHIVRPLAQGGMGEVFLADDEVTGERAVLKVLRTDVDVGTLGPSARFEHEIEVVRAVSHPLIPRWLADGDWQGRRVLALRHVDGMCLADLMNDAMSATTAVLLIVDVLQALQRVHTLCADDGAPLHLVHRDISPHNLLCDDHGRAHVIDFGRIGRTEPLFKRRPRSIPCETALLLRLTVR